MKKLILIVGLGIFALISCQKVKDPGATAAVKVANEWWVTLDFGNGHDYYGIGHFRMATYNTSANDNNIWVDDYQNGWQFKIKTPLDYTNLTFSTPWQQRIFYSEAVITL